MCMPVSGITGNIKFHSILVSEIHGHLFVNINGFCNYLSIMLHIGEELAWIIGGGGNG